MFMSLAYFISINVIKASVLNSKRYIDSLILTGYSLPCSCFTMTIHGASTLARLYRCVDIVWYFYMEGLFLIPDQYGLV